MRNSKHGRLYVWNQGGDPYTPAQIAENFDRIDALLGGPDGSPGPSGTRPAGTQSQWLDLGSGANDPYNRTLYSIVQGLNYNDSPLGAIIMWWRPSPTFALPDGWVPCDGSTYVNNLDASPPVVLHSYGQTSITVPDFRNAMPWGAHNSTASVKTSAVVTSDLQRDGQAGTTLRSDNPSAAPGIGYASRTVNSPAGTATPKVTGAGSNAPRNLTHVHSEGGLRTDDHLHYFAHTHWMVNHTHAFDHSHDVGPHFHEFDHTHGMDHQHVYDHFHIIGDRGPESSPSGPITGNIAPGNRVWSTGTLSDTGAAVLSGFGYHVLSGRNYAATSQAVLYGAPSSPAVVRLNTDGSNRVYTSSRVDSGSSAATGGVDHVDTSGPSTSNTGAAQRDDGTGYNFTDGSGSVAIHGNTATQTATGSGLDSSAVDPVPAFVAVLFITKIKVAGSLT